MKKILFSSITVVFLALMVSCGGSKSTDAAVEDADAATEQVTEQATEANASSSDVLKKYEEFVDKVIPLLAKMKTGDVAAVQEYAKLAEELGKFVQDNTDAFSALTEADAKKYEELAKKLADAAQ